MKYNNHLNYRDRRRVLLKLRIIFVVIALVLVGIAAFFYYDYVRDRKVNTEELTISNKSVSLIAPSINILKTPYFQFQASDRWLEIANESNPNKFVYRGVSNNLIEHELVVYTNEIPANQESNRVLPVTLQNESSQLVPDMVSEHCLKALNGQSSHRFTEVNFSGVKFNCDSDSTSFTVLVGRSGGDTVIRLNRPDGTQVALSIYYSNFKAKPDSTEIVNLIKTFQAR